MDSRLSRLGEGEALLVWELEAPVLISIPIYATCFKPGINYPRREDIGGEFRVSWGCYPKIEEPIPKAPISATGNRPGSLWKNPTVLLYIEIFELILGDLLPNGIRRDDGLVPHLEGVFLYYWDIGLILHLRPEQRDPNSFLYPGAGY